MEGGLGRRRERCASTGAFNVEDRTSLFLTYCFIDSLLLEAYTYMEQEVHHLQQCKYNFLSLVIIVLSAPHSVSSCRKSRQHPSPSAPRAENRVSDPELPSPVFPYSRIPHTLKPTATERAAVCYSPTLLRTTYSPVT